ncbi:MAG: CocE/NonD family hydrolase, partial [Pirellulaceae bacterium]
MISTKLIAGCSLALFLAGFIGPSCLVAQQEDRATFILNNYTKAEFRIPMRDGVHLHTTVYQPRDRSGEYPIVLNRTPYSCRPYGPAMAQRIGPSSYMERDGYIFVKQDVRGRWNSDGSYDNMRPHVDGDADIDESSDTHDTIEWLLANLQGHNGKVGITGISYPGFYSAAALPEAHPALVAASPQAPIADFYFDDFHHQGAFVLMYWTATSTFGHQHNGATTQSWVPRMNPRPRGNAYDFYLELGPLSNSSQYIGNDNFFWRQLVEHPNYDEFWQKRNILPHLRDIRTNVMTVGGWFDAEDLYGPLNIYRAIEENNPDAFNVLVMGPFSHGGWASPLTTTQVGNIVYGNNLADTYQREVEAPFFRHFLKDDGSQPGFEALMFDTGTGEWNIFQQWPPENAQPVRAYLHENKMLSPFAVADPEATEFTEFVSDPANPVPYRKKVDMQIRFTPRPYMTDDQRFASARDDVLVFQTEPLAEPVTLAGPINAHLKVSVSGTDSDWIVKLIDVYPDEGATYPFGAAGVDTRGYQQMVRSEVIRARFRNGFETPEPFVPGEVTEVTVPLQDVFHTFKAGHRIMIHVQSSWFPLIDRNPQTFVDNIFKADAEDFVSATHRVHHSPEHESFIEV